MLESRARELAWKLLGQFSMKDSNTRFPDLYRLLLYNMSVTYLRGRTDEQKEIGYKVLNDGTIYFEVPQKV